MIALSGRYATLFPLGEYIETSYSLIFPKSEILNFHAGRFLPSRPFIIH